MLELAYLGPGFLVAYLGTLSGNLRLGVWRSLGAYTSRSSNGEKAHKDFVGVEVTWMFSRKVQRRKLSLLG